MCCFWVIIVAAFATSVTAQEAAELFVARATLTDLQKPSFQEKREYCGYLGYDATGAMVATDPVAGDKASCSAAFPRNIAVTASYHTHGDFNVDYFNEVPSIVDIEGDAEFYMNGYVATPGGRLWYVDTRAKKIHQVCGLSCLPQAKGFRAGNDGDIAEEYTFDGLRAKLE